ncbi:DUF917 family protein [Arthrobacter cryoconiti]|uniref:DUF917 family protein n=1 Tax=Arthrobacter cryoconiti TaxID=748907 RepID=A0ABV8QZS2_9MICC|nr:DUF917 family protein [Arthrobacter cryoconiti]MCC9068600.1 DUF917 domain-containing protein [Arthrobacter cryoconiti]
MDNVPIGVRELEILTLSAGVYSSGINFSALRAMHDWTVETLSKRPAQMQDVNSCTDEYTYAVVSIVGSSAALAEYLPDGGEIERASKAFERVVGRKIRGIVALNLSGENALLAVQAAAVLDVPVVDGDGCGRVFPLLEQTLFTLGGITAGPFVLAMPGEETITVDVAHERTEAFARFCVAAAGGWGIFFGYAMTGQQLKATTVSGSMSGLLELSGDRLPTRSRSKPRTICRGTISALEYPGHMSPHALDGIAFPSDAVSILLREEGGRSRLIRLEAHNDIFFALADGIPIATTPDQLLLVDENYRVVDIDRLVLGLRVEFVVIDAPPAWHTETGRSLAGLGSPLILQTPERSRA